MINNTKVHRCECSVKGLDHLYTTDTSGRYVLMVDPNRAHLLRDVTWCVSRVHSKSKLLRARASASAPGIKIGTQLHQLAMRVRRKGRRVWATNRNYLDCRTANLQSLTFADVRILTSSRPSTKAVGVTRPVPPRWFKTQHRPFHATIWTGGKRLDLGWHATLEEAQAAYDVAGIKIRGKDATTNQSLGLLTTEVAKTKPCRRAARAAREVIRAFWSGELDKRLKALRKAKSRNKKKLELFAAIRAVGKPLQGQCVDVEVTRFAAG